MKNFSVRIRNRPFLPVAGVGSGTSDVWSRAQKSGGSATLLYTIWLLCTSMNDIRGVFDSKPEKLITFFVLFYSLLYFLTFLRIVPFQLCKLFAALIPLPERGGKHFLGDGSGDPNPGGIEAVGGSHLPIQGLLHMGKQQEACLYQFRWIGWVFHDLDVSGGEPISNYSIILNSRVIPVENKAFIILPGPFMLQFIE